MWAYDVILVPKMTQIWPFSPKMTYFDQIYPINDILDQLYADKHDLNNFYKLLGKKLFEQFPKILTYAFILAPKCQNFGHFH